MKNKRPKIGLALGGGGARGLAHIGVLKVFNEEDIKIDCVAGVSMGSFIGAYYCLGYDLGKLEKEAVSFNKKKAIAKMLDIANPHKSLIKGKKVYRFINEHLGNSDFNDLKIPFKVVATNLSNGDEVLINKGKLARAIGASISVPGIFPPVEIDGRYLIDGGVVNCTPVNVVEKMGADIIIGVDLVIKRSVKLEKKPTMVATLVQAYEIIRSNGALTKIKRVNTDLILIKPEMRGTIDGFKFYNIDKFIDSGEKATRELIPEIKMKIKSWNK